MIRHTAVWGLAAAGMLALIGLGRRMLAPQTSAARAHGHPFNGGDTWPPVPQNPGHKD